MAWASVALFFISLGLASDEDIELSNPLTHSPSVAHYYPYCLPPIAYYTLNQNLGTLLRQYEYPDGCWVFTKLPEYQIEFRLWIRSRESKGAIPLSDVTNLLRTVHYETLKMIYSPIRNVFETYPLGWVYVAQVVPAIYPIPLEESILPSYSLT